MKSILLIDDHDIVRYGLRCTIEAHRNDAKIFEVNNGMAAAKLLKSQMFSLVICDIGLPDVSGLELLEKYSQRNPFLIFSMFNDLLYKEKIFRAGAKAFVSKNEDPQFLLEQIQNILDGQSFSSAEVRRGADTLLHHKLSEKEKLVLELIIRKLSISQIAEELHISYSTVQTHKKRILTKLNVQSQRDFMEYLIHHNLLL